MRGIVHPFQVVLMDADGVELGERRRVTFHGFREDFQASVAEHRARGYAVILAHIPMRADGPREVVLPPTVPAPRRCAYCGEPAALDSRLCADCAKFEASKAEE